ncbi:hypothetical protein FBF29_04320 [Candidatus Saccharibacteria bacterium oral taxon 488]|nr:hypothetical protein FBF29_04320 [Candidatus Saccharibacteria bacterium oral taxon 488]
MTQFCRVYRKQRSVKSALLGIGKILSLPQYLLLAVVLSLLFALIIFFAINANFYGPLMMSRLPILDKVALLGTMFIDIFKQGFTSPNGALLLMVSILQGLSITVVIFTAKKNKRSEQSVTRQVGLSGLASVAAAIGLGCVPCGTSLILPLVAVFFSGAAAATAATVASTLVLILALLLSLFSLYKSGQIAFMHTELAKQEEL